MKRTLAVLLALSVSSMVGCGDAAPAKPAGKKGCGHDHSATAELARLGVVGKRWSSVDPRQVPATPADSAGRAWSIEFVGDEMVDREVGTEIPAGSREIHAVKLHKTCESGYTKCGQFEFHGETDRVEFKLNSEKLFVGTYELFPISDEVRTLADAYHAAFLARAENTPHYEAVQNLNSRMTGLRGRVHVERRRALRAEINASLQGHADLDAFNAHHEALVAQEAAAEAALFAAETR